MRFRKLPLVRTVRKRMMEARRSRIRRQRFKKELNHIRELNERFRELLQRWIKRDDQTARRRANEILKEIYGAIRKLARDNHQRELQVFLRNQQIPGWRRAMPGDGRRRG